MARLLFDPVITEIVSEHIDHVTYLLYPYNATATWYEEIGPNRWAVDENIAPAQAPLYKFKNETNSAQFNELTSYSPGQLNVAYVDPGIYTVVAKFTVNNHVFYFVQEIYTPGGSGTNTVLGLTQSISSTSTTLAPSAFVLSQVISQIEQEILNRTSINELVNQDIIAINSRIDDLGTEGTGVTPTELTDAVNLETLNRTNAITALQDAIALMDQARVQGDLSLANQISNSVGIKNTTFNNMIANSIVGNLWFVIDENSNEGVWYHSAGTLGLHQWSTGNVEASNNTNNSSIIYKDLIGVNAALDYSLDVPITSLKSAHLQINGAPNILPPAFNISGTTLSLTEELANLIQTGTPMRVSYI